MTNGAPAQVGHSINRRLIVNKPADLMRQVFGHKVLRYALHRIARRRQRLEVSSRCPRMMCETFIMTIKAYVIICIKSRRLYTYSNNDREIIVNLITQPARPLVASK